MKTLGSITVGDAAQLLIGKRYRGVLRRGRAITSASSDESLHALRIRCKRLRYLLEFFRPTYSELLKAETTRLKELQDVLGEFQVACVAGQLLRRYAEGLPVPSGNRGQLTALDQLIAGQDRRAATRRADFSDAWERFDSPDGPEGLLTRLAESHAPARTADWPWPVSSPVYPSTRPA